MHHRIHRRLLALLGETTHLPFDPSADWVRAICSSECTFTCHFRNLTGIMTEVSHQIPDHSAPHAILFRASSAPYEICPGSRIYKEICSFWNFFELLLSRNCRLVSNRQTNSNTSLGQVDRVPFLPNLAPDSSWHVGSLWESRICHGSWWRSCLSSL